MKTDFSNVLVCSAYTCDKPRKEVKIKATSSDDIAT